MPATGWRDDSPKLPDMEKVNAAMDRHRKERELRDAVVEAAKAWRAHEDVADAQLVIAVDDLLRFEQQMSRET